MRYPAVILSMLIALLSLSQKALAQPADEPVVSTLVTLMATAGMSVDNNGNLYIADFGDINTLAGTSLFKVSPSGEVDLITDQLNTGPSGNLIDADGSILQSVYLSNRVVRVQSDGNITDFATGIPGPDDLVQDANGNLFVASCPFGGPAPAVYRVDASGSTEIFANSQQFGCISGITIDSDGDLFASDFADGQVFRITPAGQVSLFAQLPAPSTHIKFANDGFYVMMPSANQIARIDRQGNVSILAGTGQAGNLDGPASQARFNFPFHLEVSPDGRFLFIDGGPNGDTQANPVRIIDLSPQLGAPIVPRLRAITGAWNDPARSGEGFIMQTVEGQDSAIIFWATYDASGGQQWFGGVGEFSGTRLNAEMRVTSGGVFGDDFDPALVVRNPVGTISMNMLDCDNILLDYVINDLVGRQNLARTFRLEGQECLDGDGMARLLQH